MVRFACPRCKSVLEQPDNVAGTQFTCPSCGQRLQVPTLPENKTLLNNQSVPDQASSPEFSRPPSLPPLPSNGTSANPTPAFPATLPPPPTRSRRRDRDDDDDDNFPSIARHIARRGRYSRENSAKAASSGLAFSFIALGLLVVSFILWLFVVLRRRIGVGGEPLFAVILLVVVGSVVLALLGIVFSSRGLDESNNHNRGQATTGLVCGIICLVIGSVVGLFLMCMGIFHSAVGGW